jgi:hypothetical protein
LTVAAPRSKHHRLADPVRHSAGHTLPGGNRNDVTQLLPLVDGVGPVRGKIGRPRERAEALIARPRLGPRQVPPRAVAPRRQPIIARRATEHGSGLGRLRWVVERTFA